MTAPFAASASDRALTAFRGLVLSVYPAAAYWLTHEYAVAESDGLTFSGTPTDATISPQLPTRVPYAPSLAGSSCVVPVGTLAYVGFANADPSKPFLVRFATSSQIPQSIAVDVTGSAAVVTLGAPSTPKRFAREGDTYQIGSTTGPLIFVSSPQASGPTAGEG